MDMYFTIYLPCVAELTLLPLSSKIAVIVKNVSAQTISMISYPVFLTLLPKTKTGININIVITLRTPLINTAYCATRVISIKATAGSVL